VHGGRAAGAKEEFGSPPYPAGRRGGLCFGLLHKPLDAVAGDNELFVACGKARAHVSDAVVAESATGDDRHFLLGQQTGGKFLLGATGASDARERIETAARRMTLETDFVKPADHKIAAAMVLFTHFHAHASKTTSRLLWLAHATKPHGKLVLDAGAVKAILERGVSLLPAGVTAVEGEFIAGDAIELVGPDGIVIARGLVAFDSEDLPKMLGRSTKELAVEMGAEYERELVHRDDLVLL